MKLLVMLAVSLLAVSYAVADDTYPTAGTKGTITIYDDAGIAVLDHRACVRTRGSWDYVTCGNILRDRFKLHTCRVKGAGMHKYRYQVGDSKPLASQLYCKR